MTAQDKIIPREAVALFRDASDCLENARQRASKIIRDAELKFQSEMERGYELGMAQASAEGAEIIHSCALRAHSFLEEVEMEMIEVVIAAIRKIFSEFSNEDRVRIVVKSILANAMGESRVAIVVHEADQDDIDRQLDDLLGATSLRERYHTEVNSKLARGACVIRSEVGTMEVGIEAQLSALEQVLRATWPVAGATGL